MNNDYNTADQASVPENYQQKSNICQSKSTKNQRKKLQKNYMNNF